MLFTRPFPLEPHLQLRDRERGWVFPSRCVGTGARTAALGHAPKGAPQRAAGRPAGARVPRGARRGAPPENEAVLPERVALQPAGGVQQGRGRRRAEGGSRADPS